MWRFSATPVFRPAGMMTQWQPPVAEADILLNATFAVARPSQTTFQFFGRGPSLRTGKNRWRRSSVGKS
eukprot:7875106-Pyramimonas_sp.AAC.1